MLENNMLENKKVENKKVKYNPMSKEFQDECKRLGLTGYQLIQKYKDEDNFGNFGGTVEKTVCLCPNCAGDNLQELLHTPSGTRMKCLDCEETFVNNISIDKESKTNIELVDDDDDLVFRKKGSKNIKRRFVSKEIKRSEEILDNNKKYFVFLNSWEKGETGGKYVSVEKYEARSSKIYEEGKVWINRQQLTITNIKTLDKIIEELMKVRNELGDNDEFD